MAAVEHALTWQGQLLAAQARAEEAEHLAESQISQALEDVADLRTQLDVARDESARDESVRNESMRVESTWARGDCHRRGNPRPPRS
jgi:outer membrane protein TolC